MTVRTSFKNSWILLSVIMKFLIIALLTFSHTSLCQSMASRDEKLRQQEKELTEVLLQKTNTDFTLSNPGLPGKFSVLGTFSIYDTKVDFQVYSDEDFLAVNNMRYFKLYRYNYLVKDFAIPFNQIKKIRGGYSFPFLHRKIIIQLDNEATFIFFVPTSADRKEIINLIKNKVKSKAISG